MQAAPADKMNYFRVPVPGYEFCCCSRFTRVPCLALFVVALFVGVYPNEDDDLRQTLPVVTSPSAAFLCPVNVVSSSSSASSAPAGNHSHRGGGGHPAGSCHCRQTTMEIHCRNLDAVPAFLPSTSIFAGLYVGHQMIREVPQGSFSNLRVRKISLNFNPIGEKLSVSALVGLERTLRELQLGRCQIRTLPKELLSGFEELGYLHLWANRIQKIPSGFFKNTRNLRELLLWGNEISEIDENTFAGLWKLRRLDLDKNRISTLDKEAFRHLSELQVGSRGGIFTVVWHSFFFVYRENFIVNI